MNNKYKTGRSDT